MPKLARKSCYYELKGMNSGGLFDFFGEESRVLAQNRRFTYLLAQCFHLRFVPVHTEGMDSVSAMAPQDQDVL